MFTHFKCSRFLRTISFFVLWVAYSCFAQNATNPLIYTDVPDASMIRVGNNYYMVSTTMYMSPGVPIMKSTNLVYWELVNYAYDRLIESDQMNMTNGQNAYGKGSWASSINYKEGVFYIHTFSYTSNKSHIYKTTDIENGPFTAHSISPLAHDASLFFDDDGKAYLAYGHDDITLRELNSTVTDYQAGGYNQVIIKKASSVAGSNFILTAEGTQMFKVDGWYYVVNICWPSGKGRSVVVHRSKNLKGPYEGRLALDDQGVAQGGLIGTPTGKWYAYLFQDHGAVGRIPYLVPVTWENNWPVFARVPATLDIVKVKKDLRGIIKSDDFGTIQKQNRGLGLEWQWNHNPVNTAWSLNARPGFLRLTNDRVDASFVATRNTLTQRSIGPESIGSVAIELDGMKDGDVAGLGALQYSYGYVGVKMTGNSKSIVMVNGTNNNPVEVASVPISQNRVYLKIRMDFKNRADKAYFSYSLDGKTWNTIGNTLNMTFDLKHFVGYRFGLFNFGTRSAGGFVDFDHYIINDYPFETPLPIVPHAVPGKIEAEDYASMSGIESEADASGAINIGFINSGDWAQYKIDVKEKTNYEVKFRIATGAEVNSEIIIRNEKDDSLGTLIVKADLSNDWHDWYEASAVISLNAGEQNLKLEFKGTSDYLFNIDWMEFSKYIPLGNLKTISSGSDIQIKGLYFNSGKEVHFTVKAERGQAYKMTLFDLKGTNLVTQYGEGSKTMVLSSTEFLHQGVYFLSVTSPGHPTVTYRVTRE
jgi:xylan 1,4-beta-xylosidase